MLASYPLKYICELPTVGQLHSLSEELICLVTPEIQPIHAIIPAIFLHIIIAFVKLIGIKPSTTFESKVVLESELESKVVLESESESESS